MKKTAVVIMICVILLIGAAEVHAAGFRINRGISCMTWKEYLPSSQKTYMEEDGLFHSLNISMSSKLSKNISSQLGLEFFWGNISYRGEYIQDRSPHNTTGIWLGAAIEETMAYKIKIKQDFFIYPFISVVVSDWQRQISSENWFAVIGKLGFRAEKGMFFAEFGLSRPLYTEVNGCWENVSWINEGRKTEINVNPKGEISPFGKIGIKINKRITLKLSYQELKWEKSEEDHVGGGVNVFQPKTNQKFFGLSAEILF